MITNFAIELIKHYEQLHDGDLSKIGLQPKLCPAGIWTVGYGHALTDEKGRFLKVNDKAYAYSLYPSLTEEKAEALLHEDLRPAEAAIRAITQNKLNENQLGACVSLAYNIGKTAFMSSSVLRNINAGKMQEAANCFLLWNKATVDGVKKELKGLTYRRKSERDLFLLGQLNFYN